MDFQLSFYSGITNTASVGISNCSFNEVIRLMEHLKKNASQFEALENDEEV